ncbi:O-antigen ligase family protein [Calothrix sp. 336/3]|uniref:O-antigen ligase family protein n=1 Tax=Calothrix sp. 336/3 TaxID=1337936 RepID=UPI000624AD2C|nr:O-antigen ligase family protein [Calothrix sp. 336/3]AKG24492.1 polymerase [Calothrix sp. 336/3]
MLDNQGSNRSIFALIVACVGIVLGIGGGFLAGAQPLYLGLGVVAIAICVYFFSSFEQAVLGLLILRSSLDILSDLQIPAAFAIGVDILAVLYVVFAVLTGKKVYTDNFWWFFLGWVFLQAMWMVLLPLGGLGLDGSFLAASAREWVRLFSWAMVYLLVMQLQDTIPPQRAISLLLLGLIAPLLLASLQMFVPSILPPILSHDGGTDAALSLAGESRIRGTLGHPNTFATFVLLFIGLTWWKLGQSREKWQWLILLGTLVFFYVSTKALFSLMMIGVFVLVLIAPRLKPLNIIAGLLLIAVVLGLFASSEFGQARLASLGNTPLFNPDMDVSRAILLSQGDNNSFNWRLSQWSYLLQRWEDYPMLGYGLGLSTYVSTNQLLPHNDYVRALVEGGIVGLVVYLGFFIAQGVRLWQLLKSPNITPSQRQLCQILLAILAAIPLGMITENIWSHTTLFFYWWTILAIAGWNWQPQTTTQQLESPDLGVSSLLQKSRK